MRLQETDPYRHIDVTGDPKKNEVMADPNNPNDYMFKTTFDNPPFEMSLYAHPDVESSKIYVCPKNSIVSVLDNSGSKFIKVKVDGRIGYLSKAFLVRTE